MRISKSNTDLKSVTQTIPTYCYYSKIVEWLNSLFNFYQSRMAMMVVPKYQTIQQANKDANPVTAILDIGKYC